VLEREASASIFYNGLLTYVHRILYIELWIVYVFLQQADLSINSHQLHSTTLQPESRRLSKPLVGFITAAYLPTTSLPPNLTPYVSAYTPRVAPTAACSWYLSIFDSGYDLEYEPLPIYLPIYLYIVNNYNLMYSRLYL